MVEEKDDCDMVMDENKSSTEIAPVSCVNWHDHRSTGAGRASVGAVATACVVG